MQYTFFRITSDGLLEDSHWPIQWELMQFTWLLDKNWKEVWEGDVLLSQEFKTKPWSESAKKKRFHWVVIFEVTHYEASFSCNWWERWEYQNGSWSDFYDCEVIWNIYDNPELISPIN